MRLSAILVLLVMANSACAAAKTEETVEQLVARAQSARLQDQPELYIRAAEKQLAAADKSYQAAQAEDGLKAVHDVVDYSERATDAADKSGKALKHTEITLRKMAAKLRDMKHALAFEDQAPVQQASDRLEQLRTGLLTRMFGKGEK